MESRYNIFGQSMCMLTRASKHELRRSRSSANKIHSEYDIEQLKQYRKNKSYRFKALKPLRMKLEDTGSLDYQIPEPVTKVFTHIRDSNAHDVHHLMQYILELRRKTETEDLLEDTRKKVALKRVDLDQQWKKLAYDEHQLKKNFIFFNKFVMDNGSKRQRAEEQTKESKNLIVVRSNRIAELLPKIIAYRAGRKNLDKAIKKHMKYEAYVAEVAQLQMNVTTRDIIQKYEDLKHVHHDLIDRNTAAMEALKKFEKLIISRVVSYKQEIMGLINRVCVLQDRVGPVHMVMLRAEKHVEKIKQQYILQIYDVCLVKRSIRNFCLEVLYRRDDPEIHVDPSNYEEMLKMIKQAVLIESATIKRYNKKSASAKRTASNNSDISFLRSTGHNSSSNKSIKKYTSLLFNSNVSDCNIN